MEKVVFISLKIDYFSPNTLGCHGLMSLESISMTMIVDRYVANTNGTPTWLLHSH